MKKLLLFVITLVSFCFPLNSHAQNNFAPLGAEWWYGGNNWDYLFFPPGLTANETWTDHVVAVADTSIQGISCRKLIATRTKKSSLNPDSAFIAGNAEFYLYDNTDTVFIFDGEASSFQPLYILNATDGDTICLRNPYVNITSDSNFCYIVDSVRMVVYDTTHLKTFYTRAIVTGNLYSVNWGVGRYNPDVQQWVNKGQYTERLGGTNGKTCGLLPAFTFHNADGQVDIIFPSGYLNCYYDPVTNIKRSSQDCDSISNPYTSIESVALSPFGIKVFPNPSEGTLTISVLRPLSEAIDIRLGDLSGRIWKTSIFPRNEKLMNLDVRLLPDGIYFMKLAVGNKYFYQKVIIQH